MRRKFKFILECDLWKEEIDSDCEHTQEEFNVLCAEKMVKDYIANISKRRARKGDIADVISEWNIGKYGSWKFEEITASKNFNKSV